MALPLYRRHRRECTAGHSEQSFSWPVKSKADRPNERVPFSDLELQKMYDACHNLYPKGRMYTTTGQDLADFIAKRRGRP
jgi:hypothetical protein